MGTTMHFARRDGKCLLHHADRYARAVSTAAERLKAAREAAGYETASSAAEAMGTSVSTYSQHENGTRGYPATKAQKYARFFRSSPEWLLYGKGDKPIPSNGAAVNRVTRLVPVLGEVQAGAWTEVQEETSSEDVEVVPVYLAGFEGARLFALRIKGPSMDRFYPDGTMVVVCPAAEIGVREGDHVVVRRKQGPFCETTVKEVAREKGEVLLWPRSNDPAFQEPMRLVVSRDSEDGPEIVGVVVSSYVLRPVQQRPLINLV